MKRRTLFVGGAALAGLAGGAWWSWRQDAGPDDGSVAFWQQEFELPAGGKLAMKSLRGRPAVVNFWASWCAPCVREMPQLDQFHQHQAGKGWQVLGIAIDSAAPVNTFLAKNPVGFTIALAGMPGLELVRALGNDQGALPFTVLLGRDGRVAWRKLGETNHDELIRETSLIA